MTDISKEALDALSAELHEWSEYEAAEMLDALRAALDEAEAERDAANALLRRITRNVDADGVGTVLIIDLQAARAHLGAKP